MIFKNSAFLAIFALLSALLGVLRDRLLAHYVGVGITLDIYNASFRMPDFLYGAVLAFITAPTVIPFMTQKEKDDTDTNTDERHTLSSITFFFSLFIAIVSVIVYIALPHVAHYFVPGFDVASQGLFIHITRILLIQPFLLGLSSLFSCFAQMKNHFIFYAISPIVYSLSIIVSIFFYSVYGIDVLVWGVNVGALLALLLQLYSVKDAKWKEVFGYFSKDDVYALIKLAIPRSGVNVLTQVRIAFFTALSSTFGVGALTSFIFAQRITDAVTQIVQQSITTASLPILSRDYIHNDKVEYKKIVHRYVLLLGAIGLMASLFVFFGKEIIVTLLYGNTGKNNLIIFFLQGFLLILPFHMMTGYIMTALYSKRDTKSVFISHFCATLLALITAGVTFHLGAISLVYSTIVLSSVNFLLISLFYSRKSI